MISQPKIVKTSYIKRHQNRKKQSSNTVHVTRGPSRKTRSIKKKSFTSKNKHLKNSLVENPLNSSSTGQHSTDKLTITKDLSTSQNTWDNEDSNRYSTNKETSIINHHESNHKTSSRIPINETNAVLDHHHHKKNKKNKYRRIFLGIYSLVIFLFIALATILAVILSKKSTTMIKSSVNASLRWNPSGITILGTAGVSGANSSLLYWPYGLAFDSSNTLYIVDYQNHRIQKLITNTLLSVTVAGASNRTSGNTPDRLWVPVHILFDLNDNMYITDRGNNRVQFWTKGATSGTTVAGINGTLNISLNGPTCLVSNPDSNIIFITDTYNHRVISYPSGAVVAGGDGTGNNDTQLYFPYGLVYESVTKSLVIPNYNTNNIVRWVLGATKRTNMFGDLYGVGGSNSTLLRAPVGITMDPMGNVYVADSNNHRIQLFMVGQTSAITIAGITNVPGINSTQLNTPFWVILDNQLNLYVSDTFNHRVQKFLRY